MDVLSDLLHVIRLNGAVLFRVSLGSAWSFITPPADAFMAQLPPSVRRLSVFHVVLQGHCWVQHQPGVPLQLAAGDAVVLPRCDVHILADQPEREPVSAAALMGDTPLLRLRDLSDGSSHADTQILCGFLSSEQTALEPLLAALPPLFRVSLRGTNGSPGMEGLLDHAVNEITSDHAGADNARLRIAELLFVEGLRRYTLSLPADETGWLAGLRDPAVGAALHMLHADPCHPWTVSELAAKAAVSRSLLATRFKQLLGEPPMRYLAHWRLLLATRQLHDNRRSTAAIAESVGYDSPAAFQRAFKKFYGETPAAWRRRLRE